MARRGQALEKAFAWHDLRSARIRLLSAAGVGAVTYFIVSSDFTWQLRGLAAFDAASVFLLGVTWYIIVRSGADETKRRAAAEDPGRAVLSVLVLSFCVVALGAATVIARKAHQAHSDESAMLVALSLVAVVCAWLLTHSIYALRYARLFYQIDEDGPGGLEFPGKKPPDDLDFAYFSFTLGMTFQTADVEISGRGIRRTALVHCLVAFVFNTLIVANVLNVLSDLFSG